MAIRDYLGQDSKKKIHQVIYFVILILGSLFAVSIIITLIVKYLDKQAQAIFIPVSTIGFGIYWMYFLIYQKSKKIAAIAPFPNSSPVSEQELSNRIEKINQLKLKHKLTKENNVITIVFDKSGKVFYRYMEYTRYKKLTCRYRLQLDPTKKRVLVQYYTKTITQKKEAGKLMFYRGKSVNVYINLLGWSTHVKNPFIVENGELQVTDKKLRGDGMEHILNLLMEIIVGSGWTWQPVFFLKK